MGQPEVPRALQRNRPLPEWRRPLPGMALLLCLLVSLALLAACSPSQENLPPAAHLTQAQAWASPSTEWEPPHSLAESDDEVLASSTSWHNVALPNAKPRVIAGAGNPEDEPPQVLWYRMTLPASALAATPQGPRLYIPRWQSVGTKALYVNGQLLWQSRGSRVWNSFNRPIWLDLGGTTRPGEPAVLHVRAAMVEGVGGALSSVWVGPDEVLGNSWRVRHVFQVDLISMLRGAYLVLGLFSLAVWLIRKREATTYLLFFLVSICQVFSSLHFLVDQRSIGLPDDWFAWSTLAGSQGSLVCFFYVFCLFEQRQRPRQAKALVIYSLLVTLAAIPLWAPALTTMLPLLRFSLIPTFLLVLYVAVAGAWRRRTPGSILLAGWMLISFPMGLHDLALQNYQYIENVYLSSYIYLGIITLFLVIALNRYTSALHVAARASATLTEQLAEQERILASTYEKLREAERSRTLLDERQRVMRDMHDGVGSSLMSALRMVENPSTVQVDVAQVLRECIDDLKISIDSLEPVDADLLALLANLRFRLGQRLESAGLKLHWAVQDLPPLPWLDAQNALHVLRILQEVLTNIVKHSGAREITVRTGQADWQGVPGAQVCIEDDGTPFTPPPPGERQPGRKGIGNIQARVEALGAQVQWHAKPGKGTEFVLWLPLERIQDPSAAHKS
ncbi:sensor histidine kinase [Ottowia thiooxydans]|uniref:sensor histidine kinase n=1 Tax=Ottowia thiooxydans TaxID=219182 RepID=UPI00068861BB|nr:7TM diverse intracellular signaling domain-containing protein [Ottowia thiooxydans]